MTHLNFAGTTINLSTPKVMGILNVTPDSFSDGGQYLSLEKAIAQAESMVEQGASFIDIGGESTRPGADAVDLEEESRRVLPVIEGLKQRDLPAVISIDTSKPELMKRAVEAGAGLVNDVNALQAPTALDVVANLKVPVCLMHKQGEPRTMQQDPQYNNVVEDVCQFLQERVGACAKSGIKKQNIIIDPGFGFGKTLDQNLSLLKHLLRLAALDLPVLVGVSRKSMFGTLLDRPVEERLSASIAAAYAALSAGASIIRVHDVEQTMDAIKVFSAIANAD